MIPLGPHKQRLLLAVMLCQAGETIATDQLVDVLWNGVPTRSARDNLRGYVHGLRAALGPDLVAGRGQPGYALMVRPDQVDGSHFVELSARGREAIAAGDLDAGRTLLEQALELWRGRAYQDFVDVPLLAAEEERLEAYRLLAIEQRIEARLGMGGAAELVPELTELVSRYPYRERFYAQLMLALYRSGRQAEALATYRQAHQLLTAELGVEPQAEVRQLHEAILRGEPDIVGQVPDRAPARPTPAQLPPDVPVFTGRTAELAALSEAFLERAEPSGVVVIVGPGGIGKTWLALRWAHRHRDRYPDGQLYVNLRGFDPSGQPVAADAVLRGLLDALGVAGSALPVDHDAQLGLYRSLMTDRRMLLLLDNARDADQLADLLPGSATCAVIVTSRDRLTGLVGRHGADALPLDVLGDADARELLTRRLGQQRLCAEPEAAGLLISACGGLPLALGIAAARAAVAPHLALVVIAKELGDAGTRLEALDEDNPQASLRAVLSWSYLALNRPRARMFALLGLAPGPDLSLHAVTALAGLPAVEARELLRALQRQSLVGEQTAGRWRMHDLVRLYAAEQADREVPAAERERALRRLVDFDLHTAIVADRWLNPHRTPLRGEPPLESPADLADESAALSWLAAEHACLLAVQQLAAGYGWHDAVWQLAWALSTFHRRCGHLYDEFAVWRVALPAAQRTGDPVIEGEARRAIGEACALVGRHADAATHLHRALAIAEDAGNEYDRARTHRALGYAYQAQSADRQAFHHLAKALRLFRALHHEARIVDALCSIGWSAARLGRYGAARGWLEEVLALARQHGFREAESGTLHSLGYVAHHTGRPDEALGYFEQASTMIRDLHHTYMEAVLFEHIGDSHAALGHDGRAREAWQESLRLYRAQHRMADADRLASRLEC